MKQIINDLLSHGFNPDKDSDKYKLWDYLFNKKAEIESIQDDLTKEFNYILLNKYGNYIPDRNIHINDKNYTVSCRSLNSSSDSILCIDDLALGLGIMGGNFNIVDQINKTKVGWNFKELEIFGEHFDLIYNDLDLRTKLNEILAPLTREHLELAKQLLTGYIK